MNKRIIPVTIIMIIIIPILCSVGTYIHGYNHRWDWMNTDFEGTFRVARNPKPFPYQEEIPLHEMDFSHYLNYTFSYMTAAPEYNTSIETKIVLPCDVEYYERKEDTKPVLTLKKGTTVIFQGDTPESYPGYGARCWPDYEKGWRYGYPFLTEVSEPFDEANEQIPKDWHCYNKYLTKKDFAKYVTTYVDQALHFKGHYLSEYLKDW